MVSCIHFYFSFSFPFRLIGPYASSLLPSGGVGLHNQRLVFADPYREIELLTNVPAQPDAHYIEIAAEVYLFHQPFSLFGELQYETAPVGEAEGDKDALT